MPSPDPAAPRTSSGLREETEALLAVTPLAERKALGQYFTPAPLRALALDHTPIPPGARVLEPSVGTGEFAADLLERDPTLSVVGYDIDPAVLAVAAALAPSATLEQRSALDGPFVEDFDVIVGNPPYFEMPHLPKADRDRFAHVISGRPNIFALFFAACLARLRPGGHLAFVVPPSMNNGSAFAALRSHILSVADVVHVQVVTEAFLFADAQTAVQIIVLRKRHPGQPADHGRHVLDLGALSGAPVHRVIFSQEPALIASEYTGRSTLWHLGYEAVTGATVWNQVKDKLREAPEPGTVPLVWAHNITDARDIDLTAIRKGKPQHVHTGKHITGPAIAVSRVVGSVGAGALRCAIIPAGMTVTAENHVNVIRARAGVTPAVGFGDLLDLLRAPGVNGRVQRLTGNTQMSATELTYFLPFDTDAAATADQPSLFDVSG